MDQTGSGSGLHKRMEAVSLQASALRDALQWSEQNTDSAVAALDSFDRHVSAIEASIRPAQVRAQASAMANENIDRTIETAEAVLAQFEIVRRAEAVMSRGPHEDLKSFLEVVDLLKGVIHFFSSNKNFKSCEGELNQVNNVLTKSMLKIEEEFRQLMSTYSKASEPTHLYDCLPPWASEGNPERLSKNSESATYRTPTLISSGMLPLLHDIAHQLVQDGNQQSCYRIYRLFVDIWPMSIETKWVDGNFIDSDKYASNVAHLVRDARSSALKLNLQKLGIEKLTKDNMQQWVASNIGTWTHIMHITVKVLLSEERKICDQIFDGSTFNKDQCFAEVAGSSVMTLLGFGGGVAKSKISHEKMFLQVEISFQGKFCFGMGEPALNLTKSMALAAQETLVKLEAAVEQDKSKTVLLHGNLHPLTIEVMTYVKGKFDCQSTLKTLFQQPESGSETESQLSIVTMKIMQVFQNKLNVESMQYKDPALSHIFLMNNLHYMVTSVHRSESKDILGGDQIQRHRACSKGLCSTDTVSSFHKMSFSRQRNYSEARQRSKRAGSSNRQLVAMLLIVLTALLPAATAEATGASSGGRSMRGAANQLAAATTSHGATAAGLTCDSPFIASEMIKHCRVGMHVQVWDWYKACGGRLSVPEDDEKCEASPSPPPPPPPPAKPVSPTVWPSTLWVAVLLLCVGVVGTAVFIALKVWLPRPPAEVSLQADDQGVTPVITGLPQMATGPADARPDAGEKADSAISKTSASLEEEEASPPAPPRVESSQVARPRLPSPTPFEPLPPLVPRQTLISAVGPRPVIVHMPPETVITSLPPTGLPPTILAW